MFRNYAASKDGEIISVKTQRIMKMQKNNSGYNKFQVSDKKIKKPKDYLQHRFVFEAVKGVMPEGFVIDHKNGVKTDNQIKNLQLLTPTQNNHKSHNKILFLLILKQMKKKIIFLLKQRRLN